MTLEPCPFCGSTEFHEGKWVGETGGFVRCKGCDAEAPRNVWNTRKGASK